MRDTTQGDPRDQVEGATYAPIPEKPHRAWWKQAISIGVTVLVLVIVFGFVLPKLADYEAILDYIGAITTREWWVLAVMALWFLLAYPIGMASWLFWRANGSWRLDWQEAQRGRAHAQP